MRGPQPWRTNRARVLRSRPVSAEARLWNRLRNRQLGGFKFVRQAPVGPYFADFICRSAKVVVEVDGATHGTPDEQLMDAERTQECRRQGYRVFRLRNIDVFENMDGVLDTLLVFLQQSGGMCANVESALPLTPTLSTQAGRGSDGVRFPRDLHGNRVSPLARGRGDYS